MGRMILDAFKERKRERVSTLPVIGFEFTKPVGSSALGRSLTKEWREGPLRSPSHFLKWFESQPAGINSGWRSELTGLWYRLGRKSKLKLKRTLFRPSRAKLRATPNWLSSMTPDYQAAHAAKRNTAYERARSNLPLIEVQTSA